MRLTRTLVLAVAAGWLGAMAYAQSADAVLARADRINKFMSLLEHDDPSVRLAALEEGLRADDQILLGRAIDAGLTSSDPELRNLAIIRHFSSRPIMMLEMPEGLSLSDTKRAWAEAEMPIKMAMRGSGAWDPRKFEMGVSLRIEGTWYPDCNITAGRVLCVSDSFSVALEPSEGGLFVGKISNKKVKDMPFIYKYK